MPAKKSQSKHQEPEHQRGEGLHDAACSPSSSDTPETDAHIKEINGCQLVLANTAKKFERQRNNALEEVERWKQNFIPFAAMHASIYGRDHYGDGCLHYTHYDMLKEAGARMDSFTRCGASIPPNAIVEARADSAIPPQPVSIGSRSRNRAHGDAEPERLLANEPE